MKKQILTSIIFTFFSIFALAQEGEPTFIKIKIKNNSFLPKKCTLISYTPGDQGNGTQGYWLLPKGSKEFSFKEGTKIFLANQKQVDNVMAGKRIDTDKPFLIVKKENKDQEFGF